MRQVDRGGRLWPQRVQPVTTGPGAAHGAGGGVRPRAQLEQRRHQPLQRGRAQRPFVALAKGPKVSSTPSASTTSAARTPDCAQRPAGQAAGAASHSASVMAPGRPSNCRRPACASTASGTPGWARQRGVSPARRARPLRFAGSTRRQGPTAVPPRRPAPGPRRTRRTAPGRGPGRPRAGASQPRGPSAPASPRSRTAPGTTASGAG